MAWNNFQINELPVELPKDLIIALAYESEKQTPFWREIFTKLTPEQRWKIYKQLENIRKQVHEERWSKMTAEEKDAFQRQILKWGATRWNDEPNLDDEYELIQRYKKGLIIPENFSPHIVDLLKLRSSYIREEEVFTFFSYSESPFSTCHKSKFIVGDKEFSSVLQFVMYSKAKLFIDRDSMNKIAATEDSKEIYALGMGIKYFDKNVWKMKVGNILRTAIREKFSQNNELKQVLFSTKSSTLVLADSTDGYWGIGLSKDDPKVNQRHLWKGKNMLGEILTEQRIMLMGEY